MRNLIIALLGIGVFGTTSSFAEEQLSVTAAITFFTGGGSDVYSNVLDLTALKEDNIYECGRREDGFFYKDKKNEYTYVVRIVRAGDGVLTIQGGSSWAGKDELETSFVSALPMPTTQSLGHINFYSGSPVFYKIAVWTYPTERQLATKILGSRRELPCVLKAKDVTARGLSMPLFYNLYSE